MATPVILADSSSHPEVGGDAALYFAPGDAAALGAQLLRVLADTELRRKMVARGLERSGWIHMAPHGRSDAGRLREGRARRR